MLSNLLNNALEAHASEIVIYLSRDGQLKISDNGSGFSDEVLGKLGAGERATTKSSGHGLGLSHAHKLMKHYGGSVLIKRSIWNGAEVILDFAGLFLKESMVFKPSDNSNLANVGAH